jgi:hypothetical protein
MCRLIAKSLKPVAGSSDRLGMISLPGIDSFRPTRKALSRPLAGLGVLLVGLLLALAPASASAATMVIGSPLSVPATLNTAENLDYPGTNTQVPVSPEAPNGIFHTFHFGADTALWNVSIDGGTTVSPAAASVPTGGVPATGQALKISLEGCAQPAAGGPSPLTQIHFQDISPVSGGGARVNLTSQAFEIPVCGRGGASGSTVTTYEPINLCVSQGDYVAFNDEGGYVENIYRAGVPYEVLGAVSGATADSFIKNAGTGDGAILSPSETATMDGFASNQNEELMMQVLLGTGPDATHICAGGTAGLPPVLPPIRVSPQTDGINEARIVAVAVYCRLTPECKAVVKLSLGGRQVSVGRSEFSIRPGTTTHLPIRVASSLMRLIRKHHGVMTTLTAVVGGKTVTSTVHVKIL